MSAKFYTLLTDIGAAKLASAAALGIPLKITQMAVGDGGGALPTPSAQQTALVAEKRRAALNMLYIDPQNSSQIIAEQVIPENEGGWWIREVGLFDETGALIAVGNCPESYKPQLAEGSGRTQTVRMVLITSSTDNITLKIDPAVVLATRKYVDDKVLELKVYVDDLMAKHLAAADPHTQYAPKASPTFTGTPKAPTAAAGNNSTQLANTAFVQAAIAALVASSPAALDTLKELAAALGNDPNFATTMTNALAGKMDKAANGKDIADVSEFLKNLGLVDTDKLAGRLLAPPMVITASGQFLMPSKGNLFRIRVQGAGGGSGSARATSATGLSASGGGGGGAYVELWLTRAELKALINVAGGYLDIIIGAGGVGGTGGAGGTGGTTQFGSLIVCPGGKGSDYGIAASTSTTALASGGASSADPVIAIPGLDSSKIILSMAGAPGHFGISVQSPTLAGHGANSPLGNGGVGSGASATQSDGKGYGSGAGGVSNGLSSVAKNGANGGDGVIIVEVYA